MLTISAVADCKGIVLDKIDVQVVGDTQQGRSDGIAFDVRIDLGNGLTSRERTILFNAARSCEVSKILASEIIFNYQLTADDSSGTIDRYHQTGVI